MLISFVDCTYCTVLYRTAQCETAHWILRKPAAVDHQTCMLCLCPTRENIVVPMVSSLNQDLGMLFNGMVSIVEVI